jgi:hypothetical protein
MIDTAAVIRDQVFAPLVLNAYRVESPYEDLLARGQLTVSQAKDEENY